MGAVNNYVTVGREVSGDPAIVRQDVAANTKATWAYVLQVSGVDLSKRVIQAKGGASASAGTHSDGCAFDYRSRGLTTAQINNVVKALRECGWAGTWYRTGPSWENNYHIHSAANTSDWSRCQYQAKAAIAGYDGLGSGGRKNRDTHPNQRPKTWRTINQGTTFALTNLNKKEEEEDMPLSEEDISKIATKVWGATFGSPTDTAGKRLEAAAKATPIAGAIKDIQSNVGPIKRDNKDISLRQEVADAKSLLIEMKGFNAGLLAALNNSGGKVDLKAVTEAANAGVKKAFIELGQNIQQG